jgi:hypothetical protein
MNEITLTTKFTAFDSLSELPADIQDLMGQAVAMRKKRTHPILNLELGLALLLDNGQIGFGFQSGKCSLSIRALCRTSSYLSSWSNLSGCKNCKDGNFSRFRHQSDYSTYSTLWSLSSIDCGI